MKRGLVMGYHPKLVAEFGASHGYDFTDAAARKEIAEEYIKSGKAPSGIAASTIEWHLERFVKGERVGSYMPDGTTVTAPPVMTQYLATVNQPGYLPQGDEPSVFDTIPEAWVYLEGELERDWEAEEEGVGSPEEQQAIDDRYSETYNEMHNGRWELATLHVVGPTDTHLGFNYTVAVFEPEKGTQG
jgi:hypothetical protein